MNVKEFTKKVTNRKNKDSIRFFVDIENYKYNCKEGQKKPSLYKACVYSLEVGYYYKNELFTQNYINFTYFLNDILESYNKNNHKNIYIVAHNGNKYDFHYLRKELLDNFNCLVYNEFLKNALENTNPLVRTEKIQKIAPDIKILTNEDKKACILEKRVKSKSNLSFSFFLDGIKFQTEDTYVKTSMSLDGLGKKLVNLGFLKEEEKKQTMNYTKYDLSEDLTDEQALQYAREINENLSDDDKLYIKNDIVVLANVYKNYGKIFPNGFDYNKITFTQNILTHYLGGKHLDFNTQYQLLQKIQAFKVINLQLKNSEYYFDNENYYRYLKHFYRGGLNMYNDRYIEKIIDKPCFSIDINSSYPYIMYAKKVPTYLVGYKENDGFLFETDVEISDDYFYLYKVPKIVFHRLIKQIESRVIKDMIIKYYYTIDDYSYINTNTLRIFQNILKINIDKLLVVSYVKYKCYYFNGRKKIAELYGLKQQGGSDTVLITDDPLNIKRTKHKNKNKMSKEERNNVKVLLNGLYGIPALRAYFNLFRYNGTDYLNYEQGYQNSERNLIFSIFTTSYALYNLLLPMENLKHYQIDAKFLYCDTDSLYFINDDNCILKDIRKSLLDDYNLGAFSIDSKEISKFYILNHKKYAYMDNGKIKVKCGGIPLDSFITEMTDFNLFIYGQFYSGKAVKTKHHILTEQGTMVIYDTITNLDKGCENVKELYNEKDKENLKSIFNQVRNLDTFTKNEIEYQDGLDGALYIESPYGAYSIDDVLYHTEKKRTGKELHLNSFMKLQEEIQAFLS